MVMSIHHNQRAHRVQSSDIESITLFNVTMTINSDVNGGFVFQGFHTTGGCGNAQDNGFLILIKDVIPWTKITFKWQGVGAAACWSFMDTSSNYGGSTGTPTGNMLGYSEASGDLLRDNFLTWEVSAFQSHNRTTACDNDANNFFRFNTASLRQFRMARRRNVNGSLAGIHHGRSCNTAGSTIISRISEIFIWK